MCSTMSTATSSSDGWSPISSSWSASITWVAVSCVEMAALGALDCLHAEVGDGSKRGFEFAIERRRLCPGEPDRPEQSSVGAARQ